MSRSTNGHHEYSRAEVRTEFLAAIRSTVNYWSTLPERAGRERCEGVAFSILCLIAGCSAALPGFLLIPAPHPDDKRFCQQHGESWFPEAPTIETCDIAGRLHEELAGSEQLGRLTSAPLGARSTAAGARGL